MARRLLVLLTGILVVLLGRPRTVLAEGTSATAVPVVVLAFDSEDAEQHADAFTSALKSKVRQSNALTLVETNQSLGMLTAALRCPSRPTPECQQKIAEQIKQERYIWGFVTKAGPGEVQAEAHLYQRGKPDTVATERYSDNLRDGNDETLGRVAQRALDKLRGTAVGVLVVRAGDLSGEVIVDGDKRFPLKNGTARIELSPDSHAIELAAAGAPPGKRNVLLAAGKETTLDMSPAAQSRAAGAPAEEPPTPFPTRKVIGGVAMAAGVGLGIFAFERYNKWQKLQDEVDQNYSSRVDTGGQRVAACDAKDPPTGQSSRLEACEKSDQANTIGITGIVSASVGGVLLLGGAYLLFFGGSDDKEKPKTARIKPTHVSPWFGSTGGGVGMSGSF